MMTNGQTPQNQTSEDNIRRTMTSHPIKTIRVCLVHWDGIRHHTTYPTVQIRLWGIGHIPPRGDGVAHAIDDRGMDEPFEWQAKRLLKINRTVKLGIDWEYVGGYKRDYHAPWNDNNWIYGAYIFLFFDGGGGPPHTQIKMWLSPDLQSPVDWPMPDEDEKYNHQRYWMQQDQEESFEPIPDHPSLLQRGGELVEKIRKKSSAQSDTVAITLWNHVASQTKSDGIRC